MSRGGLTEAEVYIGSKAMLRDAGWTLLAGQPPSGSNHLPVVEVKSPSRTGIGSGGAYKPDLLARRDDQHLLVECKPEHSEEDAEKLRSILGSDARIDLLRTELLQRGLIDPDDPGHSDDRFRAGLLGALAHAGPVRRPPDLWILSVTSMGGDGRIVPPRRISDTES